LLISDVFLLKEFRMLEGSNQRWPLILLCLAWGMLEGASLFGLGGTFVGLVPANIILVFAGWADSPLTQASAARGLLPVISSLLGMMAAGVWQRGENARIQPDDGFWLAWMMFFAIAILMATQPAKAAISMQAFVVSLMALVLGFQVGILYQLKHADTPARVTKTARLFGACLSYPVNLFPMQVVARVGLPFVAFLGGFWLGHWLANHRFHDAFWIVAALMVPATVMLSKHHRGN